jgi:nucleotide-binding universal stress UspA family protein
LRRFGKGLFELQCTKWKRIAIMWPAWAQEFLDRLRAVGGDAGAAILDFARESDLIVLGWRGALEPDRARTLQRVIRDTVCPVIVFRLHP